MAKLTFSLDDETVRKLRQLAARSLKPQSQVVREAIAVYAAQEERLTADEQARMLRVLDEMKAVSAPRSATEVDRELQELRRARRSGGRRHPVD